MSLKEEKQVRLCEYCFQLANNYIKQVRPKKQAMNNNEKERKIRALSPMARIAELENNLQESIQYMESPKNTMNNQNSSMNAGEVEAYKQITKNALDLIEKVTDYIFKQYEINEFWIKNLKSMIKLALLEVKTSSLKSNESMNINHFIKVKKIPYKDNSLTRYIRGLAFRKNVSHKKMITTLYNPRILVIGCSIEFQSGSDMQITSLDNLNKQERQYMHNLIKNIAMLKPSVIFVEKTVSRYAQEMIRGHGITLVFKIKEHLIKRISRLTKSQIINRLSHLLDIKNIEKMNSQLGTCEKFSIQNYNNATYYKAYPQNSTLNFDSFDPSIMYLEGCNPEEGVTMVISGPSIEELITVKKCLKAIMKFGRNVILERELVFYEKFQLQQLSPQCQQNENENEINRLKVVNNNNNNRFSSRVRSIFKEYGELNEFMINKRGLDEYLKRTGINYTKINLIPTTLDTYFDLNEVQYKKIKHSNFNRTKVEFLAQLCETPQINKVKFYSNHTDLTLAKYFSIKASNLFTKCDSCHRPKLLHTTLFYHSAFCVKVTSEIIGPSNAIITGKKQLPNDGSRMGIDEVYKDVMKLMNSSKSPIFYNKETINLQNSEINTSNSNNNNNNLDDDQDEWTVADLQILLKEEVNNRFGGFINMYIERQQQQQNLRKNKKNEKLQQDNNDDNERMISYILCQQCKTKQTEAVVLSQEYQEYSLGRYLEHLFTESKQEKTNRIQRCNSLLHEKIKKSNSGECQHTNVSRVIKYDEILFKFNILPIKIYTLVKNPEKEMNENMLKLKSKYQRNMILMKSEKLFQVITEIIAILTRNVQTLNTLLQQISEYNGIDSPDIIEKKIQKNKNSSQITIQGISQRILELKQKVNLLFSTNDYEMHLQIDNLKEVIGIELFKIIFEFEKLKQSIGEDENFPRKKRTIQFHQNPNNKQLFVTTNDIQFDFELDNIKSNLPEISQQQQYQLYQEQTPTTPLNLRKSESGVSQVSQNSEGGVSNSIMTGDYKILRNFELQILKQVINGISVSRPEQEYEGIEQFYNIVSVCDEEPISLIACALNSKQYVQEIYKIGGFEDFYQKFVKSTSNNNSVTDKKSRMQYLLQKLTIEDEYILEVKRYQPILQNFRVITQLPSHALQEEKKFQNVFGKLLNVARNEEELFSCRRILVYYPQQFEALRILDNIYIQDYIDSLACSATWQENTGGKSVATFMKSFDNKLIIKGIESKEFKMFRNHALRYFQYISQSRDQQYPSLLAKIYGMYEVFTDKGNFYYLVQANILNGLDNNNLRIYDLKGSETKRYTANEKKGQVLLDSNFRIDQNNEPLALQTETKSYIDHAIYNDTLFLSKQQVMDYSLLLAIDDKHLQIRMGIIDYIRMYTWDKKVENEVKKVMTAGQVPTIIHPNDYKVRFIAAMGRYFMEVSAD